MLVVATTAAATELYAAVGTRGFDTPVQPDLNQNGANGVYKTTRAGERLPGELDARQPAGQRLAGRHRRRHAIPERTRSAAIDLAIAPSDSDVLYAQVQAIRSAGTQRAASSASGARPTAASPGSSARP